MVFEIEDFMMALVNIFILLLFIVVGSVAVRFSIKCKTEQKNNKLKAQIYVGNGIFVWIFGIIFFTVGAVGIVLMILCYKEMALYIFLLLCILVEWGVAAFLWKQFCCSAVFLYDDSIYFYEKRKINSIKIDKIADIKMALGNVACAIFDEDNSILFEVQMRKENAGELIDYIVKRRTQ